MLLSHCPLCVSRRLRYAFSQDERRAVRCADCQLLFLNPQRDDGDPARVSATAVQATKFMADLARYRGAHGGRLLLIGATGSPLHEAAEGAGFTVTVAPDARRHDGAQFDVALLDHALGRAENPVAYLQSLHGAVKAGGCVGLVAPPLDFSGPLFTAGELHRFDTRTLQTALFFAGFGEVVVEGPQFVFCRAVPMRERRLLSLVVPAFNEAASLEALLDSLLTKEMPRLDIEIIVVESNSTDGTREIALRYGDHPRVRVILEDRPRGKGRAVRTGLAEAKGDFVLIQDADLEYDLEDYDALLEPLITGREAFVLGSRHSGSVWKMRQFSGQASLSAVLNLGHWIFTTLVNVLFRQRLKDPFTMFKVFRRDCLFGLVFECNRFDFDYELLVKLIRKGYQPIELPVNYRSRSFKEGKKVSMFRDPLNWLQALLKLRFAKIDPLAEVERQHQRAAVQTAQAPAAASAALCLLT
jgi:hypothetical protein